jgi:type II secretory pathway predicted ATPase ExeA
MAQAQTLLAAEELERRRRVLLVVGEAHLLSPQQLEELRLLTNAAMDATNPFALILVGQPMLLRRLKMRLLAALDQRISTRYQVQPLDLAETVQYLRHHLALAGRTEPLFADDAMARLHQASLGMPRALNNLACDAIIAAAAAQKDVVDDACAKRAVAELTAHETGQPVGLGAA